MEKYIKLKDLDKEEFVKYVEEKEPVVHVGFISIKDITISDKDGKLYKDSTGAIAGDSTKAIGNTDWTEVETDFSVQELYDSIIPSEYFDDGEKVSESRYVGIALLYYTWNNATWGAYSKFVIADKGLKIAEGCTGYEFSGKITIPSLEEGEDPLGYIYFQAIDATSKKINIKYEQFS